MFYNYFHFKIFIKRYYSVFDRDQNKVGFALSKKQSQQISKNIFNPYEKLQAKDQDSTEFNLQIKFDNSIT